MGKNNFLSLIPSTTKSGKMKTFAGKTTARVTALFPQSDGSLYKITRRINKDFSISDIIEHTTQNKCAIIVTGESQNLQLSGEVHTLCDLRLSWAAKGTTTPL